MGSLAQTIITTAAVITALSVIIGLIVKIYGFIQKQKEQEAAISEIKEEQTVICYGMFACLDGLKQQGCNGTVTDAHNHLQKYINLSAHDQ